MGFKSFREESKQNYGTSDDMLKLEQINAGSLQRIADATEKMASNYIKMENELQYFKELANTRKVSIKELRSTISSLKGHNTRLKNKLKQITN